MTKKILSFILLICLSFATLSLTACTDEPIASLPQDSLVLAQTVYSDKTYAFPRSLTFYGDKLLQDNVEGSDFSVTVNLVATVLPVEATNKAVDWTVKWGVAPTHGTESVLDYITATPDSDGSPNATITCIKAFGDDTILVTVTTRVGGFSATCTCTFVGLPSSLSITPTGATIVEDEACEASIATIYCGSAYSFDLALDNGFHEVGSTVAKEYTIECVGIGVFEAQQITYGSQGTSYGSTQTMTLTSFVNMSTSQGAGYFDCSVSNGKLVITPKNTVSNIYQYTVATAQGSTGWYYKSLPNAAAPYVQITVTESNSHLTATVNVRVLSDVSGVSLNLTDIQI